MRARAPHFTTTLAMAAAMAAMATTSFGFCASIKPRRSELAAAPAGATKTTLPMTLHVGETSISLPISTDDAKAFAAALDGLFKTFADKSKAARPQRWTNLDYSHSGEETGVQVELFCNPNGFTNAFQAKVLVTVSDDKLSCTTEAPLTSLKADVDQFLVC